MFSRIPDDADGQPRDRSVLADLSELPDAVLRRRVTVWAVVDAIGVLLLVLGCLGMAGVLTGGAFALVWIFLVVIAMVALIAASVSLARVLRARRERADIERMRGTG